MEDNWLDDIKKKMNGFETDEPEGLWTQIQTRRSLYTSKRRPTRKAAIYAAAAAIILFLSITYMWVLTRDRQIENHPLKAHNEAIMTDGSHQSLTANDINGYKNITTPAKLKSKKLIAQTATTLSPEPSDDIPTAIQTSENHNPDNEKATAPQVYKPQTNTNGYRDASYTPSANKRQRPKLTIGVFTSGGIGQSNKQTSPIMACASSYQWVGANIYADDLTPLVRSRASMANDDRNIDMQHNIPIRFGLSVKYNFSSRFGIESGIMYSRLGSTLSAEDNRSINGEQTLHYIGIPINIKYRVASWKAISLYASAGFSLEKCVDGSLSKHEALPAAQDIKKTIKLSESALQWSSSISADIQFDITRHIGIYVEPGVAYYFNNGSEIRNIYKDRPLNFNLNLGLRYSFGK